MAKPINDDNVLHESSGKARCPYCHEELKRRKIGKDWYWCHIRYNSFGEDYSTKCSGLYNKSGIATLDYSHTGVDLPEAHESDDLLLKRVNKEYGIN